MVQPVIEGGLRSRRKITTQKGKSDEPAGIPETRILFCLKGRLCVQIVIRAALFEDLASLKNALYSGGIDAKLLAQLLAA